MQITISKSHLNINEKASSKNRHQSIYERARAIICFTASDISHMVCASKNALRLSQYLRKISAMADQTGNELHSTVQWCMDYGDT